jgi:hypothetical protein
MGMGITKMNESKKCSENAKSMDEGEGENETTRSFD